MNIILITPNTLIGLTRAGVLAVLTTDNGSGRGRGDDSVSASTRAGDWSCYQPTTTPRRAALWHVERVSPAFARVSSTISSGRSESYNQKHLSASSSAFPHIASHRIAWRPISNSWQAVRRRAMTTLVKVRRSLVSERKLYESELNENPSITFPDKLKILIDTFKAFPVDQSPEDYTELIRSERNR